MSGSVDVEQRVANAILEAMDILDALDGTSALKYARAAIAALPGEPVWQEPTQAQIASACMSYRHDFGLLDATAQQKMKWQASEWFRAWQKEFETSPAMHCVCGNDGTALHDISCPAAIPPSNEALVKALRDLAYCDGSAENVENAEALAARVRRVARHALVQFGDKGDEPAALKSAMEE